MVDPKLQDVCNFLNKSSKKDVKQAFTLHSRKLNPTMFIQNFPAYLGKSKESDCSYFKKSDHFFQENVCASNKDDFADPVKAKMLESLLNKANLNYSSAAETGSALQNEKLKSTCSGLASKTKTDNLNVSDNSCLLTTFDSLQKHHRADVLRQKCKTHFDSDSLMKLKDTIKKQKESRVLNYNSKSIIQTEQLLSSKRKQAVGPSAPTYKGFSAVTTHFQSTNQNACDKKTEECDILTKNTLECPETSMLKVSSKLNKRSALLNKSYFHKIHGKKKTIRKTGKINLDQSVHKKCLITPTSWKEGHKVAEAVLDSMLKKSSFQSSKSTKGLLSAEAEAVLVDLNYSSDIKKSEKEELLPISMSQKKPSRQKTHSTPIQKSKDQLVVSKKKHYDSDKIRQYMAKQKVDRKRKQAECKRIKKEANDKRIKLLDNLNKRRKRKNVSLVNYSSNCITENNQFQTRTKPDFEAQSNLTNISDKSNEKLQSFLQKIEQVTKFNEQNEVIYDHKNYNSENSVSEVFPKFEECLKNMDEFAVVSKTDSQQLETKSNLTKNDFCLSAKYSKVVDNSKVLQFDRIAALRAKSESLQELIDQETHRMLCQQKKSTSCFDDSFSKSINFDSIQPKMKAADKKFLPLNSTTSFLSEPVSLSSDPEKSVTNTREVSFQKPVNNSNSLILDEKESFVLKNISPSSSDFSKTSCITYDYSSNISKNKMPKKSKHSLKQLQPYVNIHPWKCNNGDKYSVMNVFTRKYMRTKLSNAPEPSEKNQFQSTHLTSTDKKFDSLPINESDQKMPSAVFAYSNIADQLVSHDNDFKEAEVIQPTNESNENDENDESEEFLHVKTHGLPSSSLRFSPSILEQKLNVELNNLETLDEQINLLVTTEKTQSVAQAQEETVSIARVLESRQMEHEMELERLALKAKEKAVEASQKLQLFKMNKNDNEEKDKKSGKNSYEFKSDQPSINLHCVQPSNKTISDSEKFFKQSGFHDKATTSTKDKALKNAPTMRTIYKQLDDVQSEDISSKIMSKHSTTSANLPVEEASIVKEISSTEKPITLITSKTPLQENVKQDQKEVLYPVAINFVSDQSNSDDVSQIDSKNFSSTLDDSFISSSPVFGNAHSNTFNHFMNEHVQQIMLQEKVRFKHQAAMLRIREKALKEKMKAELAGIKFQKQEAFDKSDDDQMPLLKKKKRALLRKWQIEAEEIKKLKAANKAASHDQEILLQQQKNVSKILSPPPFIDQLTSDDKNNDQVKSQQVLDYASSTFLSELPFVSAASELDTLNARDPNGNSTTTNELLNRFKKSMIGRDGRRLTTRENTLLKRKKEAERLLEWKRKLDEEEKKVLDIEHEVLQIWNQGENSSNKDFMFDEEFHTDRSTIPAIDAASIGKKSIHYDLSKRLTSSANVKDIKKSVEEVFTEEGNQSLESSDVSSSKTKSSKSMIFGEKVPPTLSQSKKFKTIFLDNKNPVSFLKTRQTFENWSDESFSQTQSETEQSDVECRIHALKEELKRRRLLADRLKKQQKKKQKEHLRAQEASLKSQIEAYDAFIKSTQQELSMEFDNSTSNLPSGIINLHSTKPQIRSPRKGEQNQHISRSLRNSIPSFSPDGSPRAGSQKHSFGSLLGRQQSDSDSSGRSSQSLSFDEEQQSQLTDCTLIKTNSAQTDNLKAQIIGSTSKLSHQEKNLSLKSKNKENNRIKSNTHSSLTDLDKDILIATEDEVSEQLSEASIDHTGGSMQISHFEKSNKQDDHKTAVTSSLVVSAPAPDYQDISIILHESQPAFKKIIGQSSDLANLLTDENHVHILSDKVLNNLVKESLDYVCSIYKSFSSASSMYDEDKQDICLSLHTKKHLLSKTISNFSSKEVYQATENTLLLLTNDLLNDTVTTVLSIKAQNLPKKIFSTEQDIGNELEVIVQKEKNKSEPVLTRPVSPVFGTSQDTDECTDNSFDLSMTFPELTVNLTNQHERLHQVVFESEKKNIETLEVDTTKFFIIRNSEEFHDLVDSMITYLDAKYNLEQLYHDNLASFDCFDCSRPLGCTNKISATFEQSIFEVVRQILREIYSDKEESDRVFPCYMSRQKKRSFFRSYSKSSLLKSVKKEVTYLFGYIEPNEYKKMNVSLKWGNLKKKDNVDLLLIEELREEETDWTDYDVDESAVKIQLTEIVFDLLLNDTINCLNKQHNF